MLVFRGYSKDWWETKLRGGGGVICKVILKGTADNSTDSNTTHARQRYIPTDISFVKDTDCSAVPEP